MNNKSKIHIHNIEGLDNLNEAEINMFIEKKLKAAESIIEDYQIKDALNKINNKLSKGITLETGVFDLRSMNFQGRHLDVGGSGEEIIYNASKNDMTIIDIDYDKKIKDKRVKCLDMDVCNMDFESNYFNIVTIFYTLMYLDENQVREAFNECYRVLDKDGLLYIWDICIEFCTDNCLIIAPISVKYENKIKDASFGSSTIKCTRNKEYYLELLSNIGFDIIKCELTKNSIFLVAKKDLSLKSRR